MREIAKPEATYQIDYIDPRGSDNDEDFMNASPFSNPEMWKKISTDSAIHLIDDEIGVNIWAFVDKLMRCYSQTWKTKLVINTKLSTIGQHSFTDVLTNIADVASNVKARMNVYSRAATLSKDGTLDGSKLEGAINADKLLITGGSSTWMTDEKGNMIFLSADGQSAMTLTGNGFAIANSKNRDGDWNRSTFGTGNGFTADEIVTGTLDAENINVTNINASNVNTGTLNGGLIGDKSVTLDKLADNVGQGLNLSSNAYIKAVVSNDGNLLSNTANPEIVTSNDPSESDMYAKYTPHMNGLNQRYYGVDDLAVQYAQSVSTKYFYITNTEADSTFRSFGQCVYDLERQNTTGSWIFTCYVRTTGNNCKFGLQVYDIDGSRTVYEYIPEAVNVYSMVWTRIE